MATLMVGNLVTFVDKGDGYLWVKEVIKILDKEVFEIDSVEKRDDHDFISLKEFPNHLFPMICFEYYTDCEDCWCGEPITEDKIRFDYEEAVKKGYSKGYEVFLDDYL